MTASLIVVRFTSFIPTLPHKHGLAAGYIYRTAVVILANSVYYPRILFDTTFDYFAYCFLASTFSSIKVIFSSATKLWLFICIFNEILCGGRRV